MLWSSPAVTLMSAMVRHFLSRRCLIVRRAPRSAAGLQAPHVYSMPLIPYSAARAEPRSKPTQSSDVQPFSS
jgi:hypothetical protein